ncbi:MAG: DUF2142 domain-containing protein [Fimbriimonadaceae bacterium]|nr:DUF2142 domain-containing protein [Fimbriimonadaceae bacterium]
MTRYAIWAIVGFYLVFAILYARATPYRQAGVLMNQRLAGKPMPVPDVGAPDERQHANYIVGLREGKGFPILVPGAPDLGETYQSHQPPLYYLLATGWCAVTGSNPAEPNDGFKLRFLNILIGGGTIMGLYFAALWGFRGSRLDVQSVALATAAIGLMPMFIALNAAVGNDPLLILICTWAFALMALSVRDGWTVRRSVTIGVLIGLGLLTKTSALALIPTVMVAIVLTKSGLPSPAPAKPTESQSNAAEERGGGRGKSESLRTGEEGDAGKLPAVQKSPPPKRGRVREGAQADGVGPDAGETPAVQGGFNPKVLAFAMAILPALLIALPWWMRNQRLYGDPLALKAFNAAFVGNPQASVFIDGIGPARYWLDMVGWWTLRSFFGAFGYMDVFLPEKLYRFLTAAFVLLAIGWVLSLKGEDKAIRAVHWIGATFLVIVLLQFVQFNLTYFQGQARYLYPAFVVIALGLGVGSVRLIGRWGWLAPLVLLVGLDAYVLSILGPEFARRMSGA